MEVLSQTGAVTDAGLGLKRGDSMEAVSPSALEDDPGCGACGEVFDEPVVLSCMCCGRSFCSACLLRHWERSGSRECPLCDREPRDLTACAEHGRRFTLFCLEDLRPVCPACPGSDSHGGHRVYPLKEAAHDCKGDSMEAVSPSALEDDPCCGACGEVFDEPVVLSCMCCGRSFCSACLLRHWERSGSQECPLCDREPRDLTACAEHGRRFTLFCLEDLRPVCPACPGSDSHGGHRVYPLKEAAHDCKGDSMEAVSPSALEDDPCCGACGEVFDEPVVLSCMCCGRSFCSVCLLRHWERSGSQECPLCDREPRDLTACAEHGRRLTLFCLEDLRPVCPACPDSAVNGAYPLKEAAHDCKEELKNALIPLQENLNLFERAKLNCDQMAEHVKSQAVHVERQIQEEFEKLHQFLQEEEEARIAILKEEEEEKNQLIKEKMGGMDGEISYISDSIRNIKQEMRSEDIAFLQNYRATIKRTWSTLQDPEMVTGALLDVAKHLGNLKYSIWEKMREVVRYTPVTVDPNTAASCFLVSEDLTTVQCYKERFDNLPDNPERFDISAEMLGSEGFNGGRHSWEVDVRDNTYWVIGVAKDSINRKGKHVLTPAEGFWTIRLRNGEYKACSAPWTSLNMSREPEVIRVTLDMDRGKVTFHDPRERTPLYTFSDILSPRVLPYFCTACKLFPLRILPRRLSVTPEHYHE